MLQANVGSSIAADAREAPEGLLLLDHFERQKEQRYMLMDRAYEGEEMRAKVIGKGFLPVVPPKRNRKNPWGYDKERYKQQNAIERCILRLKRFRRIFTRYDKLDVLFCGFLYFAMIIDTLICVNRL